MTITEVQGLPSNIRVLTRNGQYLIDFNSIENLSEVDNTKIGRSVDEYFLVVFKRAGKITGIVEIKSGDRFSDGKITDYVGSIKNLKKHWYYDYLSNQELAQKSKGSMKEINTFFEKKYKAFKNS